MMLCMDVCQNNLYLNTYCALTEYLRCDPPLILTSLAGKAESCMHHKVQSACKERSGVVRNAVALTHLHLFEGLPRGLASGPGITERKCVLAARTSWTLSCLSTKTNVRNT